MLQYGLGSIEVMKKEFERVEYKKIPHLNLFVNRIRFRSVHFHNETELLCVLNGKCTVYMPDNTLFAAGGDVILIDHSVAHEIVSDGGADFVVIQFSRRTLQEYFPLIRTTYFNKADLTHDADQKDVKKLWGYIYDLAKSFFSPSELSPLYITTALSGLIAFLYEHCPYIVYSQSAFDSKKKAEKRIERIIDRMNVEYQSKLLLNEIAASEGLTPTHLSHIFHERMGVTFRDYLNELRFENALRLLKDESMNIYEIAINSGFSDVKYMTEMFKSRFDQTPAEYRKNPFSSVKNVAEYNETRYAEEESVRLLERFAKSLT